MKRIFKKKLMAMGKALALALAVSLVAGGMAYAGDFAAYGPDCDGDGAPNLGAVTFANEIFGVGSGAMKLPDGSTFQVVYTMATAFMGSEGFFMTFTLDNGAQWGDSLTSASVIYTPTAAGNVSVNLTELGQSGQSSARFYISTNSNTPTDAGDTFTLTFNVKNATALAKAGQKLNIDVEVKTDSGNPVDSREKVYYAKSNDGVLLELTADADHDDFYIDVIKESKLFTDPPESLTETEVIIGIVNLTNDAAKEDDGCTDFMIGQGDADGTTTGTLTIDGKFGAFAKAPGSLFLNFDGGTLAFTVNADATKATLELTSLQLQILEADPDGGTIHLLVDEVTPIDEFVPIGEFKINYGTATYTKNDKLQGVELNELQKNGSFARIPFVLPPTQVGGAGPFRHYVRIVNPSTTDGNVYLTLVNDLGTACTFDLEQVDDVYDNPAVNDVLKAGAGTQMISIDALYDAAQVTCAKFSVHESNPPNFPKPGKLRLDVNAEFGETDTPTGVIVNSVTPFTDGTGFSMVP